MIFFITFLERDSLGLGPVAGLNSHLATSWQLSSPWTSDHLTSPEGSKKNLPSPIFHNPKVRDHVHFQKISMVSHDHFHHFPSSSTQLLPSRIFHHPDHQIGAPTKISDLRAKPPLGMAEKPSNHVAVTQHPMMKTGLSLIFHMNNCRN